MEVCGEENEVEKNSNVFMSLIGMYLMCVCSSIFVCVWIEDVEKKEESKGMWDVLVFLIVVKSILMRRLD
jgi:branched-subunit amino acid transport protein AzlD